MKENKVINARGGVYYIAPECELIELDTTATLCQASGVDTASFGYDDLFDLGEL